MQRYPYALRVLPETLASKWESPSFAPYRDAFPAEYRASPAALTAHVHDLVAGDIKAPYLKSLQGLLWKDGYLSGALKAPLFADVTPRLTDWHKAGIALVIYSSGSVPAQKLLFQHTGVVGGNNDGNGSGTDVTPLLSGYYDTINAGPKTVAASYSAILAQQELPHADISPDSWLFLSDNVLEVEAAHAAGLQSYLVQRPGNAPLAADIAKKHRVIASFDEIDL
ncbi:enolase-phosphatase e-1s [Grosmannia clavigera kw1407]|uniref:Enolase-phosphatase e-1s n=1 Tax=Grosmannia clavigera (strain kw1407 / UAMH 11150) TaxID=655863 RepID=F0XPP2_GROCL|nr:enolase-phosphatase e-1s [Grosmannia clavigera kw1407]EFX00140.1 enolase-phosphatase e-1s [Grosmannia clavigera kw1407]